jgi:3-oxoacyl-[acyl-carrier protein] reductase
MSRDLIFLTGASSDIGMTLIRRLAAAPEPPRILAHCHSSAARIEELRDQLSAGDSLVPLPCDFRSENDVRDLADSIIREFGCPNAVVHLPGLKLVYERFTKFDWGHFEADLAVQLRSAVILLRRFLPAMAKMPSSRVVFLLSSVTRGTPPKFLSMYNIVKFAQLGLMRSLASEYGGTGITVNAVSAGMVDTRFLENVPDLVKEMSAAASPKGRNATPQDVVSAIEFLLSPAAGYIHGIELPVTGGAVY